MRTWLALAWLFLGVLAQGADRYNFATLADLAAWTPGTRTPYFTVDAYDTNRPFASPRSGHYDATSVASTNLGCVFATSTGTGRNLMDDCDDGSLDVRWFGALADDGEDDYTALQAARDAAAELGASVFFPVGEFETATTIRDVTGVSIHGVEVEYPPGGSTLTWTGATNGWMLVVGTNGFITGPTIRDITFNCAFSGNGLLLTNATRTLVSRAFFGQIYGYGIRSISANCQINNSYFVSGYDTNSVGIAVGVGSAIRVSENTFTSIGTGFLSLGGIHQTLRDNSFEFCNIGVWLPDAQNQGGGVIDGNYYELNTNGHLLIGVGTAELQTSPINERARGGGWQIGPGNIFWLTEAYPGNTNTAAVHLDYANNVSIENNVFGSRLLVSANATNILFKNNHYPMWLSLPKINNSTMFADFDEYGVDDPNLRPYVTNIWTTPNFRWGKFGDLAWNLERDASTQPGFSNRIDLVDTSIYWDNELSLARIGAGKLGSNARLGLGTFPSQTNLMGRFSSSYPYASAQIWGNGFFWADDAVPNAGKGGSIGFGGYYSDGSDPLPSAYVLLEGVRESMDYSTKGILDVRVRDATNEFDTIVRFQSEALTINEMLRVIDNEPTAVERGGGIEFHGLRPDTLTTNAWAKITSPAFSYAAPAYPGGELRFAVRDESNVWQEQLKLRPRRLVGLTNSWWHAPVYIDPAMTEAGPNASAALQIDSTSKGFLLPRMTTTQQNAIATPATGLTIFNTTTNLPTLYNGTGWIALGYGAEHNLLSGLQGGTSGEYYHLSSTDYNDVQTLLGSDPYLPLTAGDTVPLTGDLVLTNSAYLRVLGGQARFERFDSGWSVDAYLEASDGLLISSYSNIVALASGDITFTPGTDMGLYMDVPQSATVTNAQFVVRQSTNGPVMTLPAPASDGAYVLFVTNGVASWIVHP